MDYYVYKDEENIGPITEADVVDGLRTRRFVPTDLGCRVGETAWKDLSFLFPLETAPAPFAPAAPTYNHQRFQEPAAPSPAPYRQPAQTQEIVHRPQVIYQPAPMQYAAPSDVGRMMMYQANQKSSSSAYLLWFFLGAFGAHRFYCGRPGGAIGMICITGFSILLGIATFFIGGAGMLLTIWIVWIWQLVDLFLIGGWIREHNSRLAMNFGGV